MTRAAPHRLAAAALLPGEPLGTGVPLVGLLVAVARVCTAESSLGCPSAVEGARAMDEALVTFS